MGDEFSYCTVFTGWIARFTTAGDLRKKYQENNQVSKGKKCSFWANPTAQKMKFSIKDLVTFTEEILNGKLHFLYKIYC